VFGYPIETEETIKETFDQCLDVGIYPSMGFLMPLPYTKMYEYARKHGFITDEDDYLTNKITERQDICLNMTSMSNERILELVKEYAAKLNKMLELGLSEDRFVRTGGYRNQRSTKDNVRPLLDPDALERNENDFTLNYSQSLFKIDIKPVPMNS
jgi:anaerobic magnesium-protoporphyrin IX monomethyl ester cyclase